MKKMVSILAVVALCGCTISKTVTPIPDNSSGKLCVEHNDKILMDEFHSELISQINTIGIATETYKSERPTGCHRYMQYTANWAWDLAMYLTYANFKVYEGNSLLGEAEYDARGGSGRMDKFGSTSGKIEPLIKELFGKLDKSEAEK